jgi:acyl transferase domain-containing protein
LRAYVGKVIQWLHEFPLEERFADAIYTWQVGRTAMKRRLAVKVSGSADLRQKLQHWLVEESAHSSRSGPPGADQASAPALLEAALLERDLDLLGQLWTAGMDIDWRKLHAPGGSNRSRPRRIRVPTYPFARQRHWIDAAPRAPQAVEIAQPQIEVRPPSLPAPSVSGETQESRDASRSLQDRVLLDIRQLAAAVLGTTPQRLEDTTNLADYGFDSINLMNLSRRLTTHFGVEVTPVVFFSYSTMQKLCDYLATEHAAHLSEFYRASSSPAVAGLENTSQPAADLKPLCFEERWVTQALNEAVTASVRVLVCLLSDVSRQQTVREQLASCAPQMSREVRADKGAPQKSVRKSCAISARRTVSSVACGTCGRWSSLS